MILSPAISFTVDQLEAALIEAKAIVKASQQEVAEALWLLKVSKRSASTKHGLDDALRWLDLNKSFVRDIYIRLLSHEDSSLNKFYKKEWLKFKQSKTPISAVVLLTTIDPEMLFK